MWPAPICTSPRRCRREREGVGGPHFEQKARHETGDARCADATQGDTDQGQAEASAQDEATDGRARGTERDTHAHLP